MAWNHSVETPKQIAKRNKLSVPLWLALVAICAVVAYLYFGLPVSKRTSIKNSRSDSSRAIESSKKIARATSEAVRDKRGKAVNDSHGDNSRARVESSEAETNVAPSKRIKKDEEIVPKARYDVFKHRAETRLAALVCAPCGTMVIGAPSFDKRFMDDLKASLKEPIEILPDDPEDVRYYKESVIQVKKEIQEMMNRGEDVAAKLTETWTELQKLGAYKSELETQMNKIRHENSEMSEEDTADLVAAVNLMLKEKDIEPLTYNKLTGTIIQRKPFPTPEDEAETKQEASEDQTEE